MNLTVLTDVNLFDIEADVYLITVNTVGIMGKGVALEFKKRYHEMFLRYRRECKAGIITPNRLAIYEQDDKYWVMFPTKDVWQSNSCLNYIVNNLESLKDYMGLLIPDEAKIAMPPLGCGNGHLNICAVYPFIEDFAREVSNPVTLTVTAKHKTLLDKYIL